jgi:hypothetical protein
MSVTVSGGGGSGVVGANFYPYTLQHSFQVVFHNKKKKRNSILLDHHWQLSVAKIHFANDFHVFQLQMCHRQYLGEV